MKGESRKTIWWLLVVALALSLIAAACGGAAPSAPAATFLEATHGLNTSSYFFADRIKELSGGQIEIEIYPTESLIRANDLLVASKEGVVEMAAIVPFYYPGG